MDWNALTLNPRVLEGYYSTPPGLEGAVVVRLSFDGLDAELAIEPATFPDKPSPRWTEGANTCQITLRAIDLAAVTMQAWAADATGDLEISSGEDGIVVAFHGPTKFHLRCGWLQVARVEGYIKDDD
jgi:hypothetical protein